LSTEVNIGTVKVTWIF